ncbi:MAG TPA: ATP-binding protein [Ramlibacter sp.]
MQSVAASSPDACSAVADHTNARPGRLLAPELGSIGVPDTEIGRLFRATDWAATALGPVDGWPQSLRIAVGICLNSRFPMFVWWGPTLVNIYNDAYIPVLGQRHPRAFAKPARAFWSEIWDVIGPQVDMVMQEGRPTWNDRVLLRMERNGFPEDTYFTWSYSAIHDDDGAIAGLFCACSEETARVMAERERDRLIADAQGAAQTLRTWFDNAPGFIALLRGPNFVFEMVNQAYYQLVGHRKIEGLPVFEALPEGRNQGYEELLQGVWRTGQPFVGRGLRLRLEKEPGGPASESFIDIVYQPVRDAAGTVIGIFAQGHDVTEQVRAVHALKEADRRKDEFLATLAHELRNPLAPIRQAVALAKSPRLEADRRTWALDVIERQSSHMALLLEDLLDVSRISRGHLQLRLQTVKLQDVMASAVETVKPLFDRKRHRLDIALPPQPVELSADPLRLAQVLTNLLSNAAKYTNDGGHIELGARRDGAQVVITVRDDGIGLAPEAQAQIFEMFSQVAPAIERSEGGLGIGLALSRGLVGLHGGSIAVRSAGAGQGSEFIVSLPCLVAQDAPPEAVASAPEQADAPRSVLIADDNRDALESLAALLAMHGHEVHVAADGSEALAQAERVRPDVVLLDIGMPGLTGYEVARRIRASDWGQQMLLVALTGWGQAEDQARAHAAGFDHHITKPIDLERLLGLLAPAHA